MWTFVFIAVGGTLGAWARYLMTGFVQDVAGRDFPYATLLINLIGSFLMGLIYMLTLERLSVSPLLRTGVMTGFLGAFTTFSTFEMETLLLVQEGSGLKALLYVVLSVSVGFLAAFLGAYIARNL